MVNKTEAPVLIAQSEAFAGQKWNLAKDEFIIGRGGECDIVVADRQVSRHHARIRRSEGAYWAEDLGSKNGTHVNGQRLTGPYRLQDGDLIQVALALKVMFVGSEATVPLMVEPRSDARPLAGAEMEGSRRLRMDELSRRVWVGEREIDPPLSLPQYRLLEMLYQKDGQVCSRDDIVEAVWPEAVGEGVSEQSIDALVRRLRDRIAEADPEYQYVVTVRGHGFRLDNPPQMQ